MSLVEVKHRLLEKWRHVTEPRFLQSLAAFELGSALSKSPRLPDKSSAPESLRVQLVEDARRLLRGDWQLYGWRDVALGSPPCWHRDAACGVVIEPDKAAHRLNHRHLPDGADARTIWEINRWSEMTRLAMHGWLNGDAAAVRTAQLWLEDWCERNPPGQGINWTSPLEVALRLIQFTWFDALVSATDFGAGVNGQAIREAQSNLVKRIVPLHAAWVWRYRSAGSSANNHLLGELAALVVAGARWPCLSKVACSSETAWDLLAVEVLHQFAADGGSREQALHYHLFAFDLAWLAVKTVGCKAGEVHERLIQAAVYFRDLVQGAEPWDFGDSDDAQILPFTLKRSQAVAEWQAWFKGVKGPLNFWLGESPLAVFESASHPSWRLFPESGMAIGRSMDWSVRLDASPLGFGSLSAHGHGDALHVSLWDGDQALIIDPGTGGYYGHVDLRTELAAWTAHNGPQPSSGFLTPRRMGTFLLCQHHTRPSLVAEGDSAVARFDHEGHCFQRRVRLIGDQIEIIDAEDSDQPFTVRWIFAPECQVKEVPHEAGLCLHLKRGDRTWELLCAAPGVQWHLEERRVSPGYGRIEMATAAVLREVRQGLITRLRRL